MICKTFKTVSKHLLQHVVETWPSEFLMKILAMQQASIARIPVQLTSHLNTSKLMNLAIWRMKLSKCNTVDPYLFEPVASDSDEESSFGMDSDSEEDSNKSRLLNKDW